jgi:hypothetical protein
MSLELISFWTKSILRFGFLKLLAFPTSKLFVKGVRDMFTHKIGLAFPARNTGNDLSVPHQKHRTSLPLDVTHVSRLYWPPLREESFRAPGLVQNWMDQYSEAFSRFKASRLLEYRVSMRHTDVTMM